MATFTLTTTLALPYDDAVEAVRAALGEQGFGILTEIDLKATLKTKLDVDVDVARQVILGACRPALAYKALSVDPSIAAVLPCNVVVRALDDETTLVEAFDPDAMMGLADNDALHAVAADAKERLTAALDALISNEGAS
ncbi:MAG: hypothetical protein JWN68_1654 [Nocardioides sp.]|jgi:uncharacterized protein (DUF302 family)|uniref:DUF302 domain-containing protein n=1 Tax=Nocardioides sp. TaxID=35761 RepID=UPI0026134893|nr:DUF302 domain-containing protein [Nocardioides sp.]MCW2833701.1 hypothetical protein [Nocardioides sp.]